MVTCVSLKEEEEDDDEDEEMNEQREREYTDLFSFRRGTHRQLKIKALNVLSDEVDVS